MEHVAAIQPWKDSNLAGNTYLTPLSAESVRRLGLLLVQAQAYFPNQILPPGTPDGWLMAWEEIAQEYGEHRFRSALWRVCRKSKFIPGPSEIEEECVVMKMAEQEHKRKLNPYVPCGECVGSHVIRERDGRNEAVRCECWKTWKAAQQKVEK